MDNKTPFSPASEKGHFDGLVDEGKYLRQSSLYKQILPRTPSRLISLCLLWLFSLFRSLSAVALAKADAFCAFLWLKNPFNQCNPRLMKYLRAYKAPSTTVEDSLQISPFLTNKAKFRKSQMNVTSLITADYEKKTLGERGKKQTQTNPNKAKLKKAKMNVTSIITKGYENIPPIRAPKKQTQISKRQKPMQPPLPQRIMKINHASWFRQNKAKQSQFQKGYLLVNPMLHNYLPLALFPLTSPASRYYNEIFSLISCFRKMPNERVWK